MSDPVTNVEIEDVLSSIRRLVAEESRMTAMSRKADRPERLILTPAQRVRDGTPPAARPTSTGPVLLTQPVLPAASEDTQERAIDEIPRDARLAEFGAVEQAFPDLDSFDRTGSDAQATGDEVSADNAPQGSNVADAVREELHSLIEQEVTAALGGARPSEAQTEQDDDASADWSEPDAPVQDLSDDADDWSDLDALLNDAEDAAQEAQDTGHAEPSQDGEATAATQQMDTISDQQAVPPVPPQTLEDKIAALSRLVTRDSLDFEEERDRPDADDLSAVSEPMDWDRAAPFIHVAETEGHSGSNVVRAEDAWPQQANPEQSPEIQTGDAEDLVPSSATDLADPQSGDIEIDEDMLRQMVVDIVRQELQGALGERITRNVRKLVRREIHRMLISQDFD